MAPYRPDAPRLDSERSLGLNSSDAKMYFSGREQARALSRSKYASTMGDCRSIDSATARRLFEVAAKLLLSRLFNVLSPLILVRMTSCTFLCIQFKILFHVSAFVNPPWLGLFIASIPHTIRRTYTSSQVQLTHDATWRNMGLSNKCCTNYSKE